jgi:eukaryotic-like serine/threonine-protein kinase
MAARNRSKAEPGAVPSGSIAILLPPVTTTYPAPGATAQLDSGGAWALYGERIVLFHKTIGLLSFGFLVLVNLLAPLHPAYAWRQHLSLDNLFHFLAAAVSVAIWLGFRSRPPRARQLPKLDVASTALVMTLYMLSAVCIQAPRYARLELVMMLIAMIIQMARAIVVPSTARQTLWIGIVTSLALLGLTYHVARLDPSVPGVPGLVMSVAYIAIWCAVTVTVATLASRVVYGLHQQVREAQQLGQYTLDEKIGEGGMGIVYRAHHALLRRPTAVKLLPAERAGVSNLSRFEREVQLTSSLTHPNTVAIYDYGHTPDGIFYYAMEYLDGMDLEELVELHGPQDPARVVHVLKQVCGALAEAHEVGLVHRDVKPANILLCERGGMPDTAKVVDFGLVKQLSTSGAGPGVSTVNNIMGTPLYLSPEAITSPETVDSRSDLYAVGAVAYYLVTGKPVFEGETLVEVCGHHLHSVPVGPSERLGGAVPSKLETVILRCLAKQPADRPASAAVLKEELEQCGVPPWTDAQARSWWRERKRAAAAGATPQRSAPRKRVTPGANLTIDLRKRVAAAR